MAGTQKVDSRPEAVAAFLDGVEPGRRADAEALVALLQEATGEPPALWGSMVGFGQYRYRYDSGREGDSFLAGFAPRKAEFTVYIMGAELAGDEPGRQALMARLGKYRAGKACLYFKRLSDIDRDALRDLAAMSAEGLRKTYPAQ
jgi:hypothetical protein